MIGITGHAQHAGKRSSESDAAGTRHAVKHARVSGHLDGRSAGGAESVDGGWRHVAAARVAGIQERPRQRLRQHGTAVEIHDGGDKTMATASALSGQAYGTEWHRLHVCLHCRPS